MVSDGLLELDRVDYLGSQLAVELLRDPSHLELLQLQRARGVSQRLRAALDAFDIDLARRAEEFSRAGRTRDVEQAMNPDGKISASKSKADVTRAEVGAALPGLEEGLRSGQLSAEHLDIVGRARKKLTDAERTCFDERAADLQQAAGTMSLHQFGLHVEHLAESAQIANGTKRACRQRRERAVKTWEDQFSGMLKLLLTLDPENGARVHDAIRTEVQRLLRERRDNPTDERTLEQITADAVTNLILSGQQQRRPGATELVVLVDLRTLLDGLHEASVHETFDGTRVTPDTIRRIACDAHIIPIVLGGPGELLDAGRRRRTASRQQRRALRAIYRTCAIEHCTVGYERCDVHHIIPWWQHGATDLANLIPLCNHHHHVVHEAGCQLSMNPANRALTIHHPGGRVTIQPPPDGLTPPSPTQTAEAEPTGSGDVPCHRSTTRTPGDGDHARPSPQPSPLQSAPIAGTQPRPTLFGDRPPPAQRARAPGTAA